MVLPQVVGYRITGTMGSTATSTDVVLTITKHLRSVGVVGKFVEFFGPGVAQLSIADRATIANMCPEYGATVGFFPVDAETITYLAQTGERSIAISPVTLCPLSIICWSHRKDLTLKVLVATIDAQWEGMGDVGSARYEPALLPPCPTIKVLSYSN